MFSNAQIQNFKPISLFVLERDMDIWKLAFLAILGLLIG